MHSIISLTMVFNQLKFIFIIVCSATAAHGADLQYTEVQLKGSCPKIKYVNNLDMPRILGWWYRAFSTLNNQLCYNNEGQTMYAAEFVEKQLSVAICCRSAANKYIARCGSKVGSGTVTATNNPGEFMYDFDVQSYKIYVLDVEYDDFAIIYGCNSGRGSHSRDDLIFILSRDYKLTDTVQTRVEHGLQRNGINFLKAKPVKQGPRTPYTPNSRRCDRPIWGPR